MQDICLYWMYNFAEKCFITPLALDKIYGGGGYHSNKKAMQKSVYYFMLSV